MSEEATGEVGAVEPRYLHAFGVGGDYIGARRARRAFRLSVLACLGITLSLYFAEHYLRYGLSEVQFRMALTLEDDSQRAILRNVVKRDQRESEVPTAKYVAALAYIEEDDLVLERYAEAVELAPDDGALLIVYGCKLFQLGDFKEARRIFREAALKSPKNALPDYLQAAAIAASSSSEEDFRTALALIARTNDSGESFEFPQPVWHESLPRHGYWYARVRRDVADLCCAPLYTLKNAVLKRVQTDMRDDTTQGLDAWLYQLQMVGQLLVGNERTLSDSHGTSALIAGLKFQSDAIALRQELLKKAEKPEDLDLTARAARLREAMERVIEFEAGCVESLEARKQGAQMLLQLALVGLLFLSLASIVFITLNRFAKTGHNARSIRQSSASLRIMVGWVGGMVFCMAWVLVFSHDPEMARIAFGLWALLLMGIIVVASVYPAFLLPSDTAVCQPYLAEPGYKIMLLNARRARRQGYLSLSGRYVNIALGAYVCMLCVGTIGYRVLSGLYPSDIKLLVAGCGAEEQVLIQTVQLLLSRHS